MPGALPLRAAPRPFLDAFGFAFFDAAADFFMEELSFYPGEGGVFIRSGGLLPALAAFFALLTNVLIAFSKFF